MFEYSAYINTCDGERITENIKIKETECENGVRFVYTDALSQYVSENENCATIDGNNGVCIDVTISDKVRRYMADYRESEYWCKPSFGENMKDIPKETQLLVTEMENGEYIVIVPVVNDKYKNVIEGKSESGFTVRAFSWCDTLYICRGLSFVYAVGNNPVCLTKMCVKAALKALNNSVRPREERRFPEVFDYLGWCSWDAMQIRVNEENLIKKCEEFKKKRIPVKWVVIDDMWAEIRDFHGREYKCFDDMVRLMHSSSMYHFEADFARFPNGLVGCIEKIKKYGMRVGIWHPTTGYWRGYDKDGEAYKILKDYLIETSDHIFVPDWHREKSYMYYSTLHTFFRQCGADFVKIDNQSMTRRYYKGEAPVGKVASEYHGGMEASVGEHFDNMMINCMGMASEDMWNRPVSAVTRCSDDFLPENREWFANHVLMCAYNSILQGQFYYCDWDMWWTNDEQALKNSLMRAISGGPVYVSDKINESKKEILEPLMLENGKILRCDRPCTPTADCVTQNPKNSKKALKLQNTVGEYGIMAVINLDEDNNAVNTVITDRDIDGFYADEYAVYEHFSRETKILKKGENFSVELKNNDELKLYIFAPIHNGFAAIGRYDKFISPATIDCVQGETIKLKENGPYAYVKNGELFLCEN